MAGPWEQYQQTGPWSQFAAPEQAPLAKPVEPRKTVADYAKALYEVPATIVSGAAAPFVGAGAGIIENIRQGTNERVDRPELAQRFTYEPTSPVSQEIIGNLGNALETAKIPAYVPMAGQLGRTTQQSSQTIPSFARAMGQEIATEAAPIARNIAENPIVQRGTQMAQKGGEALKQKLTPEPKRYAPSETALSNIADSAFQRAKQEGVEIDKSKFVRDARDLVSDFRSFGYDERRHPAVAVAIENLTNPKLPKDLVELKTIREFIKDAQASDVPKERELGTILKSRFDEYLATIPQENLTGGSKEGLKAWREGQMAYTRLSKSQVFTEMMDRAEIEAKNIGMEKSLSNQLDSLAKNKKRMRLFTTDEQEMITEAAKGGNMQNFLRYMSKYSPSSPFALTLAGSIGAGGGALLGGAPAATVGATVLPAIGSAVRLGSTSMRKTQIERLAEAMRQNPNALPEVNWQKPLTMNDRLVEALKRFNMGEK